MFSSCLFRLFSLALLVQLSNGLCSTFKDECPSTGLTNVCGSKSIGTAGNTDLILICCDEQCELEDHCSLRTHCSPHDKYGRYFHCGSASQDMNIEVEMVCEHKRKR